MLWHFSGHFLGHYDPFILKHPEMPRLETPENAFWCPVSSAKSQENLLQSGAAVREIFPQLRTSQEVAVDKQDQTSLNI